MELELARIPRSLLEKPETELNLSRTEMKERTALLDPTSNRFAFIA
jgi:hypothetical protein